MGEQNNTSSDIYDDAAVIDAYLAEGPDGRARAEVIGNALLYLQAHQVTHDGRLLNSYAPTPLQDPGSIQVTDPASSTGNMAWAGQAFAQLLSRSGLRGDRAWTARGTEYSRRGGRGARTTVALEVPGQRLR